MIKQFSNLIFLNTWQTTCQALSDICCLLDYLFSLTAVSSSVSIKLPILCKNLIYALYSVRKLNNARHTKVLL